MSSLVLFGDTSGSVSVTVPANAGSNTVTIASQTGTIYAAGPAFYAYSTGSVTYPAGADTKVPLNTESFDTNNNFDPTTNYRFTPTVAGYYQINACTNTTYATNNSSSYVNVQVRKNGSLWSIFGSLSCSNGNYTTVSGSTIVYLNGTTDYIELFLGTNNGGTVTAQSQGTTYGSYMCGCLIRGA